MPVMIHEDGRAPVIVDMTSAFNRVPLEADIDDIAYRLICDEQVQLRLKNGRLATMEYVEEAHDPPQMADLFQTPKPEPGPYTANLPVSYASETEYLTRYAVNCTVMIPLDTTVIHFAQTGLSAETQVEEIMNGLQEPRPDTQVIITTDEVEAFLRRVEKLREPRDLGAVGCQVHSHRAIMLEGPIS